jgi:capsule polysaccharide export protein KpsE/RkpR
LLYEERDNFFKVEKSFALDMKKNELLSFELSSCHASISSLENINVDLNARTEKLSVASSSLEHVYICSRCKDFDINAYNDHVSMISKLNDDIAKLHAQLKNCKDECEKG